MRRFTVAQLIEDHGGVLPPDAVLCSSKDSASRVKPTPRTTVKPKHNRSDRFKLLNCFADFFLKPLSGAEVKVWLILFRDTKGDGLARTGQADIARRAGINGRTVRRALNNLTAKGLLKVVHRGRLNGGPSSYRVTNGR